MDGKIRAFMYYVDNNNILVVHEGYITPPVHNWQRQCWFTPDDGHWCYVSKNPCELYYRKLWMTKRDDELATKFYVEYHERKIKELEGKIEMHKRNIAVLKGDK